MKTGQAINFSRGLFLFGAIGLGAALMYMLDPERGDTRRARLGERARSAIERTRATLRARFKNVDDGSTGFISRASSIVLKAPATDSELIARTRAELGKASPTGGLIQVTAKRGHVTLSGPVLARDVQRVVVRLEHEAGVRRVHNHLTVYQTLEDIPGLQSDSARAAET